MKRDRFRNSSLESWQIDAEKLDDGVTAYGGLPMVVETWYGLGKLNRELIGHIQRQAPEQQATIDIDASLHESHKKEALWTYDGARGCQPVIAYWAEQGVISHSRRLSMRMGAHGQGPRDLLCGYERDLALALA